MTTTVTVYTRSSSPENCQPCEATKRRLTARGIPFTEVDIDASPLAREAIAYLAYAQLPVVFIGRGNHWSGYRPDRIDELA